MVDSSKPDNANNFLVAIDKAGSRFGLSYMDVSTGEFFATELDDFSSVCSEIQNLKAREVVAVSYTHLDVYKRQKPYHRRWLFHAPTHQK